jgi:hypothetical protein
VADGNEPISGERALANHQEGTLTTKSMTATSLTAKQPFKHLACAERNRLYLCISSEKIERWHLQKVS